MILRQQFHCAGVSEFPRPSIALGAEEQEEGVSDRGWSPGTQVAIGESLVGAVQHANPDFPFAVLQFGIESDESLNQDVQTNGPGCVRLRNVRDVVGNLRSYLRIPRARPELLKNSFRERPVQYAAR